MVSKAFRGAILTALVSIQSIGILASSFFILGLTKLVFNNNLKNFDIIWRVPLELVVLFGVVALICVFIIPETHRFTIEIKKNYQKACQNVCLVSTPVNQQPKRLKSNKPSLKEFMSFFTKKSQLKIFIGVCVSRFAINMILYEISLNSGLILSMIEKAASNDVFAMIAHQTTGQIIVGLGTIPGYL